jgi:catalase
MAMKFNVAPAAAAGSSPGNAEDQAAASRLTSLAHRARPEASSLQRDYLQENLLHRLERAPLRYTLAVQLEKDPETTPIENTLVEWTEIDSPSIPVADLELDRKSLQSDNELELLRFSPAHCIAAHRPLGNLGRGRLFTYTASQDGRAADTTEPEEGTLFQS